MPRTHIEALVEQWLRLQGYITWTNVPYWRPKQPGKRQDQWGEIDIVKLKRWMSALSKKLSKKRLKNFLPAS